MFQEKGILWVYHSKNDILLVIAVDSFFHLYIKKWSFIFHYFWKRWILSWLCCFLLKKEALFLLVYMMAFISQKIPNHNCLLYFVFKSIPIFFMIFYMNINSLSINFMKNRTTISFWDYLTYFFLGFRIKDITWIMKKDHLILERIISPTKECEKWQWYGDVTI